MKKKSLILLVLFVLSVIFMTQSLFAEDLSVTADIIDCWQLSTTDCEVIGSGSCLLKSDNWGSYCERISCYSGDNTNATYCNVTLNTQYNLSCGWEIYGTSLCDPNSSESAGFFGDGCSDFNGDSDACYDTYFCQWNATGSTCLDPVGFGDDFVPYGDNPSCSALVDNDTCLNISGCSFANNACTGNADGIQCSNLNKSLCSDFTMLSTCCSWNGTSCKTSFDNGCYDSQGAMPEGAYFCEDEKAYTNKTLCEQIAGSPWYMPCKFNQSGNDECHFNGAAFGGGSFASFDEISTKQGCDGINGEWKTEQYNFEGVVKTDSWCEFKFGFENDGGGNCDTACWSCETGVSASGGNTSAQAETYCENSALGYCEYFADANAQNGLGWCNPKQTYIDGGGKSCDDECSACDYLNNPQAQCGNSTTNCVWVNDTGAGNGVGYCFGQNEKRCGNDCFSCYTQNECTSSGDGGNGACVWDSSNFCKSTGFTGEVCFDGKDNDNDNNIDCLDSDCATDKFCGGAALGDSFGQDCPVIATSAACTTAGCVWLTDDFDSTFGGADAGFCDFPGAQCWQHDVNSTACGETSGCSFITSANGFCEENNTIFDSCFQTQNSTACGAIAGCGWATESYNPNGGHCEPLIFSQCFNNDTRRQSQTLCESNMSVGGVSTKICSWNADPNNPQFGGWCDPVCFNSNPDNASCSGASNGLCETISGLCEPDSFGGKCFAHDGNQTACEGLLNQTCGWKTDVNSLNNVSVNFTTAGNQSGWCDPKGAFGFINFIGEKPPVIIGTDENESTISDHYDIQGVGIHDEFDKVVFGARLFGQFNNSALCNGAPTFSTGAVGTGQQNFSFYWYIDTNGNNTDNCATRDNISATGYEFSFRVKSYWSGTAPVEIKTSYQCVNGTWGATPIPLSTAPALMCDVIGGGMAGIDKKEMFKFKGLFNKSADLRLYSTVGDDVVNDSVVNDTAGPFYYSQGAMDFKFEDCSNTGGDGDGDGLTASNDPDCFDYLKFGYVPNEMGFQCKDGIDNDGDSKVDCEDEGCKYDTFACGGTLVPDENDTSAPKIVWQSADTFPDSAFIMYDTNEPANGTLAFYSNDSTCKTINKTVLDVGIKDSFLPTHKLWHDGPIDNFGFNSDAIGFQLSNGSTYYFKTTVCDISGNCAVSACTNFTTKTSLAKCKGCTSTFTFPFNPPSGVGTDDPLGNLTFSFEFQDGSKANLSANAGAGTQLNYTQTKNFNLIIENPTSPNESAWKVKLINASITGKVSGGIQNFSGGQDVTFNSTTNGSFVGLGDTKCQELINTFRPKKLEIGVPGNSTELWQCTSSLQNCSDKTSNATLVGFNSTTNLTSWHVPAEWGC